MTPRKRQMSLVGFMQAGNATVYAGSWRHPATEHGFLDASYYEKLGRTLEEGCFDMMFFDDRLAMPGHLRRLGGRGGPARRPSGEARPQHRARGHRRGHRSDRPGRHLLDHLLLAVPRGPDLRHPRPPDRRPGGVERRDLGQRQRGAELRRSRSISATTSATTGPTSSSRPRPGCGTPGRTTRWSSTGPAASSPTPTRSTS